jgi:hypothetical protein
MTELEPVTMRPRRRLSTAVVFTAGAIGGMLAVSWPQEMAVEVIDVPTPPPMVEPVAPPPTTTTVQVSFPITIHVEAPAPVRDPEQLGPCPAPHRRATEVAIGALPEPVTKVAASWLDTRLVAAWTAEHVYASTDEGRSFQRVLDHAGTVGHAAFDCHGRLHVARVSNDGVIELGTFDEGAAERWTRVGATAAETYENGNTSLGDVRLVPFDGHVAVIAAEPGRGAWVVAMRRDERGRWRTARVLEHASYTSYGSWHGVSIEAVEPRGGDRIRLLVMPYQGGECGYNEYADAVLDLRSLASTVTGFKDELPASRRAKEIDGVHEVSRDAAGRWLGIDDKKDGVVRLTAQQLAEREPEPEPEE